jgi:molybdopterin-synthase adenylyltransferase
MKTDNEKLTQSQKEFYKRQIQLWGEDTQLKLATKKIAIIGCGGLGCSLALALGSSGIGYIDLVDFDDVSIHNIHRQIGFTIKDEEKNKAEVLKNLLKSRSIDAKINSFEIDFNTFSITEDYYDLIIDATDNLIVREEIDKFSKEKNIPWLYGSVESFHGQVCLFDKSSFASSFTINDRKPEGIAAPIVMQIASLQANVALRFLAELPVKKDILYYCFFNDEGEYQTQKFTLPKD